MTSCIIKGQPAQLYFDTDAISRGDIKRAAESLALYLEGDTEETTPAMALGHLAHIATLEPERYATDVVVRPPSNRSLKNDLDVFGGKVWKGVWTMGRELADMWDANHKGKTIATEREIELAQGVATAVAEHPAASLLLRGDTEVSLYWDDVETGERCKARFDAIAHWPWSADLKVCADPSPDGFKRMAIRDRLHIQDAHYTMGIAAREGVPWHEVPPMTFVAVRSMPPHTIRTHALGFAERNAGADIVRSAIDTIHACRKSGDWRNHWEKPEPPMLCDDWPEYALRNPFGETDHV